MEKNLEDQFIEFLDTRGYPPEPWCRQEQMKARDWVFDDFSECEGEPFDPDEYKSKKSKDGRPEWWKQLVNVQRGKPSHNSIDNCVGEFHNFHSALGKFFGDRHHCDVKLLEEPWFEQSDATFDDNQFLRYIANKKVVALSRKENSEARNGRYI